MSSFEGEKRGTIAKKKNKQTNKHIRHIFLHHRSKETGHWRTEGRITIQIGNRTMREYLHLRHV